MSLPPTLLVTFPLSYTGYNKVDVIKILRSITNFGLKQAKDLSEATGNHIIPVQTAHWLVTTEAERDALFEEQCRILRANGCTVGDPTHKILQSLRELAADALKQGDDDIANEILQLVLAEKLRRKS
jgi:Ribosomal protein L7/L12 C-terminal domain